MPGGARRLGGACRDRSRSQLAIQPVTCRLEAMPSVKRQAGQRDGDHRERPAAEEHGRDQRRRSSGRPASGSRGSCATGTAASPGAPARRRRPSCGISSRKSPQDSRLRSALMTAVPGHRRCGDRRMGVEDAPAPRRPAAAGPLPGVVGPVCSLIRSENDSGRLRIDEEVAGERMAQQLVTKGRPRFPVELVVEQALVVALQDLEARRRDDAADAVDALEVLGERARRHRPLRSTRSGRIHTVASIQVSDAEEPALLVQGFDGRIRAIEPDVDGVVDDGAAAVEVDAEHRPSGRRRSPRWRAAATLR